MAKKIKGSPNGRLKLNPENILSQNNNLDSSCDRLKDSYKRIRSLKDELLNTWSGKASEKYDSKFEVLSDRYKERVKPVKDSYVKTIEKMVKGHSETEKVNTNVGNGFIEN